MSCMISVNQIFKSNIIFGEYSRSGIVYYTDDLEELNELQLLGWRYNQCSVGYRIIPPSISVCDITELEKVFQYQNVILNYAYFLYLKKLLKENKFENVIKCIISKKKLFYKNFEFHISSGPIIETEIKVEGLDDRIYQLKRDLLIDFLAASEYKNLYKFATQKIEKNSVYTADKFNIDNLSQVLENFYKYLIKINENVNKKIKIPDKIYSVDMSVLGEIDYDVLLFIPNGCYKFLNLFVNEKNYKKVMFWEFHIDKTKPTTHKIFNKNFRNKKILLVDSVYSGKTLLRLKKMVEEQGGHPILLGLYPKSKSVINILDYTIILNRLYSTKELDLNDLNMYENLYINTMRSLGDNSAK